MMQRTTTFSSFLLAAVLFTACSPTQKVVNHAPLDPQAVLAQQNVNAALYQNASAEVAWLFEQGYAHARLKLDVNLRDTSSLKPAVIVDVDETVLDNSPYELENLFAGRTYNDSTWKLWTARATAKPMPGALAFLKYAESRGCAVFYITNRHVSEKDVTIANLKTHGFPMADNAHVMTMDATSDKTERRQLVQAGHRVVLYVGDQLTDYNQLLKDRSIEDGLPSMYRMSELLHRFFILLPNSTYGYWRDGITGKGSDAEKLQRVQEYIKKRVE
jgi:5'-nucleotidase (lipoprotein e(P4) family)